MPRPRQRRTRVRSRSTLGISEEHVGWREPGEQKAEFQDFVENILYWATIHGTNVAFFKFSTRTFGTKRAVMADLKRQWNLFTERGVWRRIESALWVFADHRRAHVHLIAELPAGVSMTSVRNAWRGGFTHAQLVRRPRSSVLGAYLAAQWSGHPGKRPERLRYWGLKRRERQCLACKKPTAPPPSPPYPSSGPQWRRG